MTTTWAFLRPRDTVAVRDGRPFDAGVGATARAVFPWPSTVAGAVGALAGREVGSVRGPLLASGRADSIEPLFPIPTDVVAWPNGKGVERSRVVAMPSGVTTDLPGLTGLVTAREGKEPVDGWCHGAVLANYLAGTALSPDTERIVFRPGGQSAAPVVDEAHVGLTLTTARTAEPGLLYTAHHLRLAERFDQELGFLVAVDDPGQVALGRGPVRLGGESRLADVTVAHNVQLPAAPATYPDGRVLVYLATPGIFARGWLPDLPSDARVVAAALKDPVPVAMASSRRRASTGGYVATSLMHWAVPAGSVYYLQFPDPASAARWAVGDNSSLGVHGLALPAFEDRLRTAGFGVALTGNWTLHEEM